MSEFIGKEDGTPFATETAARAARTRMGKEGLDTNVVQVDGGWALIKRTYDRPKKRIPIGKRNILTVRKEDKDPDYVYRFVNDEGDRIRMFRDAGWEVVEKRGGMQVGDQEVGDSAQLGSLVTKTVGKKSGMIGYLMRIKKDYYEEDQETKAANIRQIESGLKMNKKEPDEKGQYGQVKIGNQPQY